LSNEGVSVAPKVPHSRDWRVLNKPGAKAHLQDAIAAMQSAGVADDEIATFRNALSRNDRN